VLFSRRAVPVRPTAARSLSPSRQGAEAPSLRRPTARSPVPAPGDRSVPKAVTVRPHPLVIPVVRGQSPCQVPAMAKRWLLLARCGHADGRLEVAVSRVLHKQCADDAAAEDVPGCGPEVGRRSVCEGFLSGGRTGTVPGQLSLPDLPASGSSPGAGNRRRGVSGAPSAAGSCMCSRRCLLAAR
jgi:hypothetical protein